MTSPIEDKVPIVCLSTQDFDDLWTRKQRFMIEFARRGHRVLYVESEWHLLTYLRYLPKKWSRIFAFLKTPREVEPDLFIATPPLLLPFFQMFTPLALLNNFVVGLWLAWTARRLRIKNPLVYTYVAYSYLTIKLLGSHRVLYEKVDDVSSASGLVRKSTVDKLEKRLLKMTQLVIVTASRLKTLMQDRHDNIHVIPNACEVEHFNATDSIHDLPALIASIPRPRIGFVGAVAYWIDLDLIEHIAAKRPHWHLIIVGPVFVDVRRFTRYPNVHFVGRLPYESLPSYMAGIDLFINPYKEGNIADSCSPLKVFEYLAAGKPVVSVPMPEVMRFAPDVRIASDYEQFIGHIEEFLSLSNNERRQLSHKLMSLVKDDNWENRFNRTRQIMAETYQV